MPRNRSHNNAGRRAARRPRARGRRQETTTAKALNRLVPTSLIQAQEVTSNAAVVLLTFNQPVVAGDPSGVQSTDISMAGTSATTRNGISTTPVDFTSVRVNLSGSLTQSKTYNLTIAADQGLIQPANGVWGTRTKSFTT